MQAWKGKERKKRSAFLLQMTGFNPKEITSQQLNTNARPKWAGDLGLELPVLFKTKQKS